MTALFDSFALKEFVSATRRAAENSWHEETLKELSSRQIPADVLGYHSWLLQADARLTWANWFVDSLVNRSAYIQDDRFKYAHLYADVRQQLHRRYQSALPDELSLVASQVTDFAWSDIESKRQLAKRHLSRKLREELWFAAEPEPRCYLCGYRFDSYARDKYLNRTSVAKPGLPGLVDVIRPRGMLLRDLQIEVDHVRAVSVGGATATENLRLACGWCNAVKSNRYSLYASPSVSTREVHTRDLGRLSLPQPMWVLRIVATRGRCEDKTGCDARLDTHELYLAPSNDTGVLNPANAFVCCKEHDPWSTKRLVGRGVLRDKPTV